MISAHCNLRLLGSSDFQLIFVFLVETGFHHVGQAGLELVISSDPPASAPQSARITGVRHRARPRFAILQLRMFGMLQREVFRVWFPSLPSTVLRLFSASSVPLPRHLPAGNCSFCLPPRGHKGAAEAEENLDLRVSALTMDGPDLHGIERVSKFVPATDRVTYLGSTCAALGNSATDTAVLGNVLETPWETCPLRAHPR
uniref:Uncharacterized protein n=1 Tax=Macaca fascicularis TaxID=9541 RepID=A0A7N9CD48_MACFA